jgi:adenine-specific DNA-methyltransferase
MSEPEGMHMHAETDWPQGRGLDADCRVRSNERQRLSPPLDIAGSPGSIRSAARAWIASIPSERRRDLAVAFSRRAFIRFAELVAPWAVLSEFHSDCPVPLDPWAARLSDRLADFASELPAEEGAHQITSLYTALLDPRDRSAKGAFYTPPVLVRRLIELADEAGVDWRSASVLDPASGGGAFLLAAAAKMRAALGALNDEQVLAQIGERLCGFELDAHAAWLSQAGLEVTLGDLACRARRRVPQVVKVCDTLEQEPAAQFDLVIGNPPYGRVTLSDSQRRKFARGLYGHANLYGVFTDIALRWTRPGGVIAYLTPTSMLGGQYFSALRGLLAREAPPFALDFVQARRGVFEDVLQETLLALYRRAGPTRRLQVHYLKVRDETAAEVVRNGTVALPVEATGPWLAPRDPSHSALIASAETMPTRLRDWGYEVSTGPLVWNRYKSQLREKPGERTFPLIWAEAITADGRFVYRAERRNHSPYFRLERGDAWLLVEEGCVLLQRTTAKEQPRRLIAAEMPDEFVSKHGGVVVENHLNMVRATTEPQVSARAVAALLNSAVADQVFRCISGSVAVSAFELESLPLPSVAEMQGVEKLLAEGAPAGEVEAAVADLYRPRSR